MNRRSILKQLSALTLFAAAGPSVMAQEKDPWAGKFTELPNRIAPEETGKVEVIEFFHYGCPHCRNFHPLVKAWLKVLPEDVVFRANPVIWGNEQLRGLARLHYAAERTGTLKVVEDDIYVAVQDQRLPLHTADGVADWIAKFDLDAKKFMATYNSFALQALVQRADQVTRAYRVQGVPTVAVGGRFLTSASMSGSHENTLRIVDTLIPQVRATLARS